MGFELVPAHHKKFEKHLRIKHIETVLFFKPMEVSVNSISVYLLCFMNIQLCLFQVSFKNPREESKTQTTVEYKRVFCFPLYSLLLAYNSTKIDLMCINAHGFEFQVRFEIIIYA